MQYIRRVIDRELAELLGGLAAISIEGAKGVGKTETASRIAKTAYRLDEQPVKAVAEADLNQILRGEKPVLIDEWQRVPACWDGVRRAVDDNNSPGQFILTGSATPPELPSHSGAGRIVVVRMRPLALVEREIEAPTVSVGDLLSGEKRPIEGTTNLGLDTYVQEIVQSGFPGIRHLSGRSLRAQLEGYLRGIADRDFEEQGLKLRRPDSLKRWMTAYAAATSTTTSFETIRDASTPGEGDKPAKKTTIAYRDILERIWLVESVPAWAPPGSKVSAFSKPPKHHLVDPALAVHLLGLDEQALLDGRESPHTIPRNGTLLGHLFESLVTQNLRVIAQHWEAKVRHLRTKKGEHEVDLILVLPDQRILAVEIKMKAVVDDSDVRHLKWLERKMGDLIVDSVVINTGTAAYRRKDGIAVVPASLIGL